MPGVPPLACDARAYSYLFQQLRCIDSTSGLLRGAIAVAMHCFDDIEPHQIERQLENFARRVRRRVRGPQTQARLAHLHQVLFEEEGFVGNADNYYSPLNSYLPTVLASRQGIPVTLGLVYKVVAEMAGLRVVGLNFPGHFLVRVVDPLEPIIVDPFLGGRMLGPEDLFERFGVEWPTAERPYDAPYPLPYASHRQWISRIIANLQHIFAATGRLADLAAMSELQDLVAVPHRR